MTSLFDKIPAPLILVATLGGCTAVTEGPKFLWGSNVERRASEMGRVCLGESGYRHIANPITWFLPSPHSYWFAKSDQVQEHKYLNGVWVVQSYGVNLEEGQWVSLSLIDVNKERIAYLGDLETDSKQEITKKFDNPDWKNLNDPNFNGVVWVGNAIDWINNGKQSNANYCD